MAGAVAGGQEGLRRSTRAQYEAHIRLNPYLGRIRLDQLRVDHLADIRVDQVRRRDVDVELVRLIGGWGRGQSADLGPARLERREVVDGLINEYRNAA
jgi:hypothetical protein